LREGFAYGSSISRSLLLIPRNTPTLALPTRGREILGPPRRGEGEDACLTSVALPVQRGPSDLGC
jgi:hypothetical protein